VVCAATPEAGLRRLEQLQADGGQLALVLADQWMPSMTGVEFLGHVWRLHPGAQRVVLINWDDRSTAEPILQASALGQIDDWAAKPWGPGDEFFHQAISGFLNEWARLHRPRFEVFRVVGEQWAPRPMRSGTCWAATASPSGSTRSTRPCGLDSNQDRGHPQPGIDLSLAKGGPRRVDRAEHKRRRGPGRGHACG
jgi:CheY-like chemotaxis protein